MNEVHVARIIAVDPIHNGFGFVVLEGPQRLVDWGIVHADPSSQAHALARLDTLLLHYDVSRLVIEDTRGKSRRGKRVRELLEGMALVARKRWVKCSRCPMRHVKFTFSASGHATKRTMAEEIVAIFPELRRYLPRPRKPWMSEDLRMAIFDSAGLALTHYRLIR